MVLARLGRIPDVGADRRRRRLAAHRDAPRPQPHRGAAAGTRSRSRRCAVLAEPSWSPSDPGSRAVRTCSPCVAAVLLLAGNAFFVGAEFSLVSARRDRLEAMAQAGISGARTVLRASADLSRMLAASQLGITICSLLLGRLGEPAVAHLIERPFALVGSARGGAAPDRVRDLAGHRRDRAHPARRDGAEEHRDRRPGDAPRIWLVPPFLVFTTAMRPLITCSTSSPTGCCA